MHTLLFEIQLPFLGLTKKEKLPTFGQAPPQMLDPKELINTLRLVHNKLKKEITNGINKGIIQDRSWAFK